MATFGLVCFCIILFLAIQWVPRTVAYPFIIYAVASHSIWWLFLLIPILCIGIYTDYKHFPKKRW